MKEKVCIVILNYNNYKDTKECIDSVLSNITYDNDIVLVDNCSTDDSFDRLKREYGTKISYIQTGRNCGYAIGNNIGLKYAYEKGYQLFCVLNNDTIVSKDFLTTCIKYINTHKHIGFVSPLVLDYSTGRVQSTGGRINLWTGNVNPINKNVIVSNVSNNVECDYVGGACMVFQRKTLEMIGYIPENYFLFFEETEWCYKALSKGLKNICLIGCNIMHKGSVSINKTGGLQEYLIERNRVVFERRNCKLFFQYYVFILYLFIKNFAVTIVKDHSRVKFFAYYMDGLKNRIDKRFPFIYLNND